jgi:hypothetical protein
MPYSAVMAVLLAATAADPGAASSPGAGPTTRETRSESALPYTVFVESPDAELRAGPGSEHYVTNRLERGTRLEVYRHDPGGWFAVRPPLGSFSWVEADTLRMTDEPGVAEVTGDEVHSWVGTTEQVSSHSWQVRLKRGEMVEVLGVKQFADAATGQAKTWYRIAPPAGEFRWINGLAASRTLPEIATGASGANGGSALSGSPAASSNAIGDSKATEAERNGSTAADRPLTGTFAEQLDALEVEVSLMAASDAQQWDFAPMRQRAEQLVDAGTSAVERGQARRLLEQIEQFDDLDRRHEALDRTLLAANQSIPGAMFRESSFTARQPSSILGLNLGALSQSIGTGVVDDDESAAETDFDATGWLVPVHSLVPGAPPYALVNEENTTLSYLTPAPGRNVHRYLGRQVGIIGERSYVPHLDAPHVTVRRVVDLERQPQ